MTVWVVAEDDLDSWFIHKCFDSEDKAKKCVDEHNATVKYSFDEWYYFDLDVE